MTSDVTITDDGFEKHDVCLDRWGECPHWVVSRPRLLREALIRGVSHHAFRDRDVSAREYLDVVLDVVSDARLPRYEKRRLRRLIDERQAVLLVEQADSIEFLRTLLDREVESDPRESVVGAINRRIQSLND